MWRRLILALALLLTAMALPAAHAERRAVEDERFLLPYALQIIGESAFERTAAVEVRLQAGVRRIDDRAFAEMPRLRSIYIPPATESIGESAFASDDHLVIHGVPGSFAEDYAEKYGFEFVARDISGIPEDGRRPENPGRAALPGGSAGISDGGERPADAGPPELTADPKERPEYYPIDYDFP